MKAYHVKINRILEQTLLSDWRFGSVQLRVNKSKKGVIPNEGDLVLIRADNLCDPGKYGIVEKILSPQIVRFTLRGGNELERPVNLVNPLVPQCMLN